MEEVTKRKFDANEYLSNYAKEHYDKITIITPKGYKDKVKTIADADRLSMSQYVIGAIEFYEKHRNKVED